jgi:hypothetical protein
MTRLRALLFAALIGGLAVAACGGALTPAAPTTAAPAGGTNDPANPPKPYPTKPSSDPYSGYGY